MVREASVMIQTVPAFIFVKQVCLPYLAQLNLLSGIQLDKVRNAARLAAEIFSPMNALH